MIESQFHGAKMKINVEETVWVIGYLNLRSDRDRYIRKGETTLVSRLNHKGQFNIRKIYSSVTDFFCVFLGTVVDKLILK